MAAATDLNLVFGMFGACEVRRYDVITKEQLLAGMQAVDLRQVEIAQRRSVCGLAAMPSSDSFSLASVGPKPA